MSRTEDTHGFLRGNLVFLIAGLVLMMGVCFADYTRIGQRAREIMAMIDILLIGATVFSRAVNGAKTFLYLPVIGYITIEYVFLLTVPVYAAYCTDTEDRDTARLEKPFSG